MFTQDGEEYSRFDYGYSGRDIGMAARRKARMREIESLAEPIPVIKAAPKDDEKALIKEIALLKKVVSKQVDFLKEIRPILGTLSIVAKDIIKGMEETNSDDIHGIGRMQVSFQELEKSIQKHIPKEEVIQNPPITW